MRSTMFSDRPSFILELIRDKSPHRTFFTLPEAEFRAELRETNLGRPNFGPDFSGRIL